MSAKKASKYSTKDIIRLDMTSVIDEAVKVFKDSSTPTSKKVLKLDTIVSHSDKVINRRVYPGKHQKAAMATLFTNSDGAKFNKPILKNHDPHSEPMGRVVDAKYRHILQDAAWAGAYLSPSSMGSGYGVATSHIMDMDAIEKFLDGRYATVSISGDTNAAFCSTCTKRHGQMVDFRSEFKDSEGNDCQCEHTPGQQAEIKDGIMEKTYIITGELFYDEVSQVNIPADDGAVHIAKELILKDSASGIPSMYKNFDFGNTVDIGLSVPRFAILDAQGNTINGLCLDTYVSTKTFSLPSKDNATTNVQDSKKTPSGEEMTEECFAKAVVMDHFSKAGQLTLSDSEKEEVAKLASASLTDTQKAILDKKGFFINKYLPFTLYNKYFVDCYREYADKLSMLKSDSDKKMFMDAVEKQAAVEKIDLYQDSKTTINSGDKMLTKEQEVALLKEVEDGKKEIQTLKDALQKAQEDNKTVMQKIVKDKAVEVVALRKELKFHDVAKLEGDDLVKVQDEYAKKGGDILDFLISDLKAQKLSLKAILDEKLPGVEDPTKLVDGKSDTTTKVEDQKDETVMGGFAAFM